MPALAATAQLGLGLCEEELGNAGKAKEIYRAAAGNTAYDGTAAKAAAANRLKTMDDYQGIVVFKPAPPPQTQASVPSVQITPGAASSPVVIPVPVNPNPAPAPAPAPEQGPAPAPTSQASTPAPEPAPAPTPTGDAPKTDSPPAPTPVTPVPEANSATGG